MQLTLHRPDSSFMIREVGAHHVLVGDTRLESSFVLAPDELRDAWPATDVASLDENLLGWLLEGKPEVVLLGTGRRQRFIAPALHRLFLAARVGLEIMDNQAAARTFAVLASEDRRVRAGFLLPGE